MPGKDKVIYLTFDDGPHPVITPFVLAELKKYNARATFFCIGKNLLANPDVYKRILAEGHAVGNHSFSHLNGWKTKDEAWLADITEAKKLAGERGLVLVTGSLYLIGAVMDLLA